MRVLIFGATGTLGRPVTRRFVAEGLQTRALARNPARARRLLPSQCEIVPGDLRDEHSVLSAMREVDAVYINLASPFSANKQYDPDRDGTRQIVRAAQRAGVRRVVRLSAVEVMPGLLDTWWVLRRKAEADEALMNSGLRWTIFRPTWFMESIPYFLFGRLLAVPNMSQRPLHWISADDYARQVVHALGNEGSVGQIHYPRGPEPVPFAEATRRFARAFPRWLMTLRLPMWAWRAAGLCAAMPRYLVDLIQTTERFNAQYSLPPDVAAPEPRMRIEDYVEYMVRSGDKPSKLPHLI